MRIPLRKERSHQGKRAERHGTLCASFFCDGLTFCRSAGILETQIQSRLSRVERTEYGMWPPTAIRNRVEVRNGPAPPNAFVSGQPKKISAGLPAEVSRHGWVVPMQRKNRE